MRKNFDAVIIGGGPGGLSIGSLLSREGISSAIIEKNSRLGGRYRSVDFHGCRVDCAVHLLVSMEKAFPGFNNAIEYEGMNLQLNFSRYAYAVVSTEIDIQSPNIEGLYFAGDSIWSVGKPMSDKCYEIAFPLCEKVTQYLRSGLST